MIRVTNHKLDIARKETEKPKKIVEKQKTKVIDIKRKELKEELVCPVKKRGVLRRTLKMKLI